MPWPAAILVYFLIWWTVLFAILPWGNRAPEEPEEGHAPSAPARPRIALKFLVTTLVAAVLWLVAFLIIQSDWISFREWSRTL